MFATPIRQAGFWRRSLDELRRQATIAVRMEGLHDPQKPYPLVRFNQSSSPSQCKIICDSDMGGFSKAALTYVPSQNESNTVVLSVEETEKSTQPAHALFHGAISTELPPDRLDIQRSGYAAWRTRDRGLSLFGRLLWDIDSYGYLALRIKSDGRKYFVNIQTESIVPTDLHQHLLPCYSPGEWETVTIPFSAFVRTNYGMVVEPQKEMLRQKIRSFGIGLTDRLPGPFELSIADIYATNRPPARRVGKEESGFILEEQEEEAKGMLDEVDAPRKKGEPERILI